MDSKSFSGIFNATSGDKMRSLSGYNSMTLTGDKIVLSHPEEGIVSLPADSISFGALTILDTTKIKELANTPDIIGKSFYGILNLLSTYNFIKS